MVGIGKYDVESAAPVNGECGKDVPQDGCSHGRGIDQFERPGFAAIDRTGNIQLSFRAVEEDGVNVAVLRVDRDVSLVARLNTEGRGCHCGGRTKGDAAVDGLDR